MDSSFETAPKLFTLLWNVIKPVLHKVTVDKVRIFGCDPNEWKAALLEEIEADQLPVIYGGTLTDPKDGDPRCLHVVRKIIHLLVEFINNC